MQTDTGSWRLAQPRAAVMAAVRERHLATAAVAKPTGDMGRESPKQGDGHKPQTLLGHTSRLSAGPF